MDWCNHNKLDLNVDKTEEIIVDFRRKQLIHTPLYSDGTAEEIVQNTKFLGVHIADLTWSQHTSLTKKAHQWLHLLRRLKRAHLPPPNLTTFYKEHCGEHDDQLHLHLVYEL